MIRRVVSFIWNKPCFRDSFVFLIACILFLVVFNYRSPAIISRGHSLDDTTLQRVVYLARENKTCRLRAMVSLRPRLAQEALFGAATGNCPEAAAVALDASARIEEPYPWDSAIDHAARLGHKEMVEFLLREGDDPDVCLGRFSPLFWAVRSGNRDVVRLLLSAGADPNRFPSSRSRSSLIQAVENGDKKMCDLLLAYGADLNVPLGFRTTPLHRAVALGYHDIAQFLINHRAVLNAQNEEGASALHLAAETGQKRMVDLLLKSGADVGVKNTKGERPIDVARENGYIEIAREMQKIANSAE